MIDLEHYKNKDQAYIHAEIVKLSKKIVEQQAKADKGLLKTYGGALGIADLKRDRDVLRGLLEPIRLVSVDGCLVETK